MPIDLETGKTFRTLVAQFAEQIGVASFGADGRGEPGIPATVHELAICKSYVNSGYKDFLQADADWTFLNDEVILTLDPAGAGPFNVNGDPARYRLPQHCTGHPRGNWRFRDDLTSARQVICRPMDVIDAKRQGIVRTGVPELAGVRGIPSGPLAGKGSEVVFYPAPDAAYTLVGLYRVLPYDLVDLDQRHVAGAEHDNTVLAAALHKWAQRDGDEPSKIERGGEYARLMALSKDIDRRKRTRNFGRMRDPSTSRADAPMGRRAEGLVTHHNGNPIP